MRNQSDRVEGESDGEYNGGWGWGGERIKDGIEVEVDQS